MGYPLFRFRSSIPVLLAAFLFVGFVAAPATGSEPAPAGLLDGKAFVVEKGRKGGAADGKDTYLFRDAKFRSTYFEKHYGFDEGAYTSTATGDTITFSSDIQSKSHGTVHWEGMVRDGDVDVRYTWAGRKGNPKPVEYWARSVTEWGMKDPGPPGGGAVSHLLDGKTFYVNAGEKGKDPDHDDYLIFRDGMFTSSGCVESWNFRNASYSATAEGDGIRFRAQLVSTTHGTLTWEGTVRGDAVDATARWLHKKWYWTIDREYWYRGRLFD